MLELGRKESHLFSGILVQILIVGLLVFAYTQAIRQLKHSRELYDRYQEQLTMAREEMSHRPPSSDLASLQREVEQLKRHFAAEPTLTREREQMESWAASTFHFQEIHLRQTDLPVELLNFPIQGRPDFEVELYGLELTAQATTREAAAFLAAVEGPNTQPMMTLAALEVKTAEVGSERPVHLSARWLVPVVKTAFREEGSPFVSEGVPVDWGQREEPFSSP